MFFLEVLFDLCFDIDYTISLINRIFLRENHLDAKIKKMFTSIIVKGIRNKRHEASEYIRIKIYLSGKDSLITLIKREFYIVNGLITKALIDIDIMKSKGIVIDLQNNVIKIGICQSLEVSIVVTNKESRINAIIYSSKRTMISLYCNVAILVSGLRKQMLDLFYNRNFLYEP